MRWGSAILVLAAALAIAAPALADGDPASDYLLTQRVFAPFDRNVPTTDAGQLGLLVNDAHAKSFPIKVALVGSRQDLGAVTSLWRQPQRYAEFLGQELRYVYEGTLLIVMPNGYGVAKLGKPQPQDGKILAALPAARTEIANLPRAATAAVVALAQARGIRLVVPQAPGSASRENHDRVKIAVVAAAIATLLAASAVLRRTLRTRRRAAGER